VSDWSDEETRDPLYVDERNFFKSEIWTRDGMAVDCLLYAGNSLAKAEDIFARAIKRRPPHPLDHSPAHACCNSTRSEIQKADDGNTVRHSSVTLVGYSITLSARATNVAGTVTPIALAVLRLITNSNLVGCSIGISAGFAPFKSLTSIGAISSR
jgi:hypothetical protein